MKKIVIGLLLCGAWLINAKAQSDYKTSIGIRLGAANGLTVKHFTSDATSLEGILSTRWDGFIITGLYEINQDVFDTRNFNFYYGGGAHVGFWDLNNRPTPWDSRDDEFDDNSYVAIGIDGIVGLEYTFDEVPFNLSLDWKPAFNLIEDTGFWFEHFGLSVRFIFP
ncbi:MAG: hypothetical protein GVY19_02370 [Bacteroidetes bacterium]|jgi:hypothetical protein|nr:hypothetical protein [Bacteroidota bacterium]